MHQPYCGGQAYQPLQRDYCHTLMNLILVMALQRDWCVAYLSQNSALTLTGEIQPRLTLTLLFVEICHFHLHEEYSCSVDLNSPIRISLEERLQFAVTHVSTFQIQLCMQGLLTSNRDAKEAPCRAMFLRQRSGSGNSRNGCHFQEASCPDLQRAGHLDILKIHQFQPQTEAISQVPLMFRPLRRVIRQTDRQKFGLVWTQSWRLFAATRQIH
jgi:hypothetical protein